MLLAGMQVPTPSEDRRMADIMVGAKRPMTGTRDVVDTMLSITSRRRFNTGESSLTPMRSSLPSQLARGLTVVNTGLSTTNAQTDEIITQPIFAKPFRQGWE